MKLHKPWIEQGAAAEGMRDEFGTDKALGYLIGEKLINFLEAADTRPEFATEVKELVAKVRGRLW